ncbi:hypothetical protein GCM10020000_35380 [Streptomyces olivoverticillatus]
MTAALSRPAPRLSRTFSTASAGTVTAKQASASGTYAAAPRHELFAAIPLSQLKEQDRTHVDALRLMAYSTPSLAAVSLERLVQEARTTLLSAAAALPSREPTLGMLRAHFS